MSVMLGATIIIIQLERAARTLQSKASASESSPVCSVTLLIDVFSFIADCLDSLLLMGMTDEYARARSWVETELSFDVDDRHHAFEVCSILDFGVIAP